MGFTPELEEIDYGKNKLWLLIDHSDGLLAADDVAYQKRARIYIQLCWVVT